MKTRDKRIIVKNGKSDVESDAPKVEKTEVAGGLDSWTRDRLKSVLPESWFRPESRGQTAVLAVLLSLITILLVAPFAGKAFHIDDPLYIWTAKHIVKSPLNFYGYNVNWYGADEPMSTVMKNPPLASYYLAIVGAVFGWGQVAMHLAMVVPAVVAVLGTFFLARLLCRYPLEAALISLLTPVFLVSANTVMCDVFMLSFWVWAVWLWVVGLDKNKYSYLGISAIFMAAAALSKYPGMATVPLLFAYSVLRRRRPGWWLLPLAVPVLVLVGFQWYTHGLYGKGLLTAAAEYPPVPRTSGYTQIARGAIGLGFVGGCLASSFFYVPFLWRRRYILLGAVALVAMAAVMPGFDSIGGFPIHDGTEPRWGVIIQFCLFVFAGMHILALAALDLWTRRDSRSALLLMWVAGVFVFATFVNWVINARSVLSMLPAVGILVARRLETQNRPRMRWWNPAWALIPSAVLALMVTVADYRLANCGREAADEISLKYGKINGVLWYDGHWGFQYYIDLHGAKSMAPDSEVRSADVMVIPENSPTRYPRLNPQLCDLVETISLGPISWLTTVSVPAGAGFYADAIAPLPYVFGPVEPERYLVWKRKQ
jgi:4-amino-4-deoxy-L-arabinose transferase-like glycosyltransferase